MDFDGQEYLWQGDPTYWREQAPHLFPIIGRLTKGRCTMDGDPVTLDVHGFFRRRPMELAAREADRLTLVQSWDAETLRRLPAEMAGAADLRPGGQHRAHHLPGGNLDESGSIFTTADTPASSCLWRQA